MFVMIDTKIALEGHCEFFAHSQDLVGRTE